MKGSLGTVAVAKREFGLSAQIWTHSSKPTFNPCSVHGKGKCDFPGLAPRTSILVLAFPLFCLRFPR